MNLSAAVRLGTVETDVNKVGLRGSKTRVKKSSSLIFFISQPCCSGEKLPSVVSLFELS